MDRSREKRAFHEKIVFDCYVYKHMPSVVMWQPFSVKDQIDIKQLHGGVYPICPL